MLEWFQLENGGEGNKCNYNCEIQDVVAVGTMMVVLS